MDEVSAKTDGSASSGPPFTMCGAPLKRDIIDSSFLRDLVEDMCSHPENYSDKTLAATASQKEEMRDRLKTLPGNYDARLFFVCTVILYACDLMAHGDFYDHLKLLSARVGFFPGSTHFRGGWHQLLMKHFGIGQHHLMDLSGYDIRLCVLLIQRAYRLIRRFSRLPLFTDLIARLTIDILIKEWDGTCNYMEGGNKSGQGGTIFLNMLIWLIVLFYTLLLNYTVAFIRVLLYEQKLIIFNFTGDDSLITLPSWLIFPIDSVWTQFGAKVKIHKIVSDVDIEYLSKHWLFYKDFAVSYPDVNKLLDGLYLLSSNDPSLYYQQLASDVREAACSPLIWKMWYHVWWIHKYGSAFGFEIPKTPIPSLKELRDFHTPYPY